MLTPFLWKKANFSRLNCKHQQCSVVWYIYQVSPSIYKFQNLIFDGRKSGVVVARCPVPTQNATRSFSWGLGEIYLHSTKLKPICTCTTLTTCLLKKVLAKKNIIYNLSTFSTQQTALLPYKGTTQGRCGEGGDGRIFIECIKMTAWYRWGSAEDHLAKQFKNNSWFEWLGQRRQRRGVHPDLPA